MSQIQGTQPIHTRQRQKRLQLVLGAFTLVVLASVGGIARPAQAMVSPDHLILPGQSIGPVHIGDRIAVAEDVWGTPSHVLPFGTHVVFYLWDIPLDYDTVRLRADTIDGVIEALHVLLSPAYKTSEGIGPLSLMAAVSAAYGPPEKQSVVRAYDAPPAQTYADELYWNYPHRGLVVIFIYVDRVGYGVLDITVMRPQL